MKKILIILLACLLCSVFVGCGTSNRGDSGGNSGNNSDKTVELIKKDPSKLAKSFVQMLLDNDFKNSVTYFNLKEPYVISDDDVKWAIERGDYSDLIECGFKISDSTAIKTKTTASAKVNLVKGKGEDKETKTVNLTLNMNDNNAWFIDIPAEFVYYKISIPGNTSLKIGDKDIDAKYKTTDKSLDTYTIYCPSKNTKFTITTSKLGTFSKDIMPCNNENAEEYCLDVTSEEIANTLMNKVQNDLNAICDLYEAGTLDRNTLAPFFDSSKSGDTMDAVLNQIKQGYKASTGVFTSITVSDIKVTENTKIYIKSDNEVTVNCTYNLTKPHSVGVLGVKTPEATQWLRYKMQDDGSWKISEYHEGLFEFDQYNKESAGIKDAYTGAFQIEK